MKLITVNQLFSIDVPASPDFSTIRAVDRSISMSTPLNTTQSAMDKMNAVSEAYHKVNVLNDKVNAAVKTLYFDDEARLKLSKGVDSLARAISATFTTQRGLEFLYRNIRLTEKELYRQLEELDADDYKNVKDETTRERIKRRKILEAFLVKLRNKRKSIKIAIKKILAQSRSERMNLDQRMAIKRLIKHYCRNLDLEPSMSVIYISTKNVLVTNSNENSNEKIGYSERTKRSDSFKCEYT